MAAATAEQQHSATRAALRGRHRRTRSPLSARVRTVGTESLFRNSVFLALNLALGAGCGYGGLLLLTRLFTVQAVGLSATAASASALIVFIMQFGVNYSLPRFLPTSSDRPALVNTFFTIITIATIIGAIIYLASPVAGKLYALGGWLFGIVFLVGTFAQAGESLLETILVAERSSSKVARGNVIPNLIKLAAPPIFFFIGALGSYIARVMSDIVGFIVFSFVLARRGHRFRPMLRLAAIRGIGKFSVGMYIASLFGSLPLMVVPIIILSRFGSRQGAYWAIAITIASLLYQLPGAVAQALLPEIASRPSDRRYLLRRSAALIAAMVVPVLAVAYIAAPLALALFGHAYVSGSLATLRWLIIAGLITVMNYVTGAILFLAKKTLVITVINVIDAVIVLGAALTWAHGAREVAIGWVVGDIANTILFAIFALFALRQVKGRWEALGNSQVERDTSVQRDADSQQQGIEALIMLAEAQRTGPWQGTRPVPVVPLGGSFRKDGENEQYRSTSPLAARIEGGQGHRSTVPSDERSRL